MWTKTDYDDAKQFLKDIRGEMAQFAGNADLWRGQASFDPQYRELTAQRDQLNRIVSEYEEAEARAANPDPVIARVP